MTNHVQQESRDTQGEGTAEQKHGGRQSKRVVHLGNCQPFGGTGAERKGEQMPTLRIAGTQVMAGWEVRVCPAGQGGP